MEEDQESRASRMSRRAEEAREAKAQARASTRSSESGESDAAAKRRARGASVGEAKPGTFTERSTFPHVSRKEARNSATSLRTSAASNNDDSATTSATSSEQQAACPGAVPSAGPDVQSQKAANLRELGIDGKVINPSKTDETETTSEPDINVPVVAEMVEDIDNPKVNQKMKQEMENLRRQMESMQRSTVVATVHSNEDDFRDDEEEEERCSGRLKCCIAFWLTVVIAIVVAIVLATRKDDADVSPTVAPMELVVTESPTSSPTEALLYEPPSDKDCAEIASGGEVENQGSMSFKEFDVDMDVILSVQADMVDIISELQEKAQQILAPALAECSGTAAGRSLVMIRGSGHRRLINKYAVANTRVSVKEDSTIACNAGAADSCVRMIMTLEMSLRGLERNIDITRHISDELRAQSLKERLGLPDVFASIDVDDVRSLNPTDAPSYMPTNKPSSSPTSAPTKKPSSSPTSTPTPKPSSRPTSTPTPKPTTRPTDTPSSSPTLRPTPKPTSSATLAPTVATSSPGSGTDESNFNCPDRLGSCTGIDACLGINTESIADCGACILQNSCNSAIGSTISFGSCVGKASCRSTSNSVIGEKSCNGLSSCRNLKNVNIRRDSCNCENCCSCLPAGLSLPEGSCNVLANNQNQIDLGRDNLNGPPKRCCMAPTVRQRT